MSKKPVSKVKKNLARAFLITGMVFSILGFAASLALFFIYFGAYAILLVILIVIGLIALAGLGIVLLFLYLFVGFFAALFGATNFDFLGSLFPSAFEQVLPIDLIERFGYDSLLYLIGLPIISTIVTISFVSMIYAIVALCLLNSSSGKAGGIVGGVFAILSGITGVLNIIEFAGGMIMFFITKEEYMVGHEEPKEVSKSVVVVRKPIIDKTN